MELTKKIAVIHDIAGFGRCALSVCLPVISAMKVQACPVPTSIFSNHTAFPTYHFTDYTTHMTDYFAAWEALSLSFDGILCGFLGSVSQIQIVEDFLDKQNAGVIVIDPVMGDHGKAYRTITDAHCQKMKSFIQKAEIITPNLTESCLLTDTPYKETGWSPEELTRLCQRLHSMGPSHIVITGINENSNYVNFMSVSGKTDFYKTEKAGESRPGTGDIFASIIAASAVKGIAFTDSVKQAADFIRTCTNASSQAMIPVKEGVCFESFLNLLLEQ